MNEVVQYKKLEIRSYVSELIYCSELAEIKQNIVVGLVKRK